MNLKRLVFIFSLVLVLAPVSAAYSYLFDQPSDSNASHCKHMQSKVQDKMPCCGDDHCGPSCKVMHCGQIMPQLGMPGSVHAYYQSAPLPAVLFELKQAPGGGWFSTPLRPPIHIL